MVNDELIKQRISLEGTVTKFSGYPVELWSSSWNHDYPVNESGETYGRLPVAFDSPGQRLDHFVEGVELEHVERF